MRLAPTAKLFFGFKIDGKMREALAQATPGDRRYFDDPASPYLRVLSNGDEQWIGKLVDGGIAPSEVEDIQRNVISILNRVAPGGRHSPSAMRVFSVDDTPMTSSRDPGGSDRLLDGRDSGRDDGRDR
jgi:hypothetical protein